ncbi:hypothetical protein CVT25_004152 [Psilocybe cyanescens]|uniref:F-box domain-containing protein n=1 Tax=Psilocybe cyanescens TaxID=93625 RepID=A0A409XKS4_PSICY|nr:hypothetical protein CVT25_004152 [Psilocybe cyanescens]
MAWVPSAATQFSLDIWSQISKQCDRNTLRQLATHEVHSVVRQSALPYLFKKLHFHAFNLLRYEGRSLTSTPEEHEDLFNAKSHQSSQRFMQLPLSRFARYVRTWTYEGFFYSDEDPETAVTSMIYRYNQEMWPFFAENLACYTGLTNLSFRRVVIDERAVISLNKLANLRDLSFSEVDITSAINLGSPHIRLISLQYIPFNFLSAFIVGACATLGTLRVHVSKEDHRALHDVLEHCPVLNQLAITLTDEEDSVPSHSLSITACPNLTEYIGPGYYAGVIAGRPVREIELNQCPRPQYFATEETDWLEVCGRGTVPVEVFWIHDFPTFAIPDLFPVIMEKFPLLTDLQLTFYAYTMADDNDPEDIEISNQVHYLSIIHDVSTGKYEVPGTLRYLEILLCEEYEIHPTITLAQVVDRIQSSEKFTNLDCLILGNKESYQCWNKDETGVWSMIQYGEDDLEGGDNDGDGDGSDG